jgi:hypothetical protein
LRGESLASPANCDRPALAPKEKFFYSHHVSGGGPLKPRSEKHTKLFSAGDYPHLCDFFSAYLHQDFKDEYGSPAGAVSAFCTDATPDEFVHARREWLTLRRALAKQPLSSLQVALQELGAAWLPQDENDLHPVDTAFFANA